MVTKNEVTTKKKQVVLVGRGGFERFRFERQTQNGSSTRSGGLFRSR